MYAGVFPSALKSAEVLPLFKKGDHKNVNNYRPISILPSCSKVFEKAIKNRVLLFLDRTKFFSDKQFGFRAGYSTEEALLNFCSQIFEGVDNNKSAAGLFVDITKAFDMVNHNLLLGKLYNSGFRGFIYDWFKSYLHGRTQKVKISDRYSETKFVNIGVPQGSVLGPILFLIFINSIFQVQFKSKQTAFADDLACGYSGNTLLDVVVDINSDVELLRYWFGKHRLVVSSKTKVMFFNIAGFPPKTNDIWFHSLGCKKFKPQCSAANSCLSSISDTTFDRNKACDKLCFIIDSVDSFKYLGVEIDSKLSWKKHTDTLHKYMLATVRSFYHLKRYSSPKVLLMAYYGILHSKLEYGISCWGGAYLNKIQPLLIAQKYVVRIICGKNRFSRSFDLFRKLYILPIRHLYYYKVLKIFYKRCGYLNNIRSIYNLRVNFQYMVIVPAFSKTIFMRFFTICAPRIFNRMPLDIRGMRTISSYLRRIKSWLFLFNHVEIESLNNPVQ